MRVWEGLINLDIADNDGKYPVTEVEALEMLALKYKRKESSQ